jgi:signal transduction histidine kinase
MEKTKGPNGDTSAAKRLCGAPRSADSGVGPRNHLLISGRGEEVPPEQSLLMKMKTKRCEPIDLSEDAQAMLREREAGGLRLPIIARLLFAGFGLLQLAVGRVPSFIVPIILAFALPFIAVNAVLYFKLRDQKKADLVGWAGMGFDIALMVAYAVTFGFALHKQGVPLAALPKSPLPALFMVMIVINTLALRPRYPVGITIGAVLTLLGVFFASHVDPVSVWGDDNAAMFITPIGSRSMFVGVTMFVLIGGLTCAVVATKARQMVVEVVEREAERRRMQDEHANVAMESKLRLLGDLVASLSHEMNSPLGALKSAAETSDSALAKLKGLHDQTAPSEIERHKKREQKLYRALESGSKTSVQAVARLEQTLTKLSRFSQLDRAERQSIDIHAALDEALSLVPLEKRTGIEVMRDYNAVSAVSCFVGRLQQVFSTILTNACEAIDGSGTIRLRTREQNDQVRIELTDSGRGMSAVEVSRLFELRFGQSGNRVSASLGLAASQSVIRQHGGEISVESEPGVGTTFVIVLPVG